MKVSRMILRGVGSFEDFDRSFVDSWTETVPNSLVLIGTNGSGKTTIINSPYAVVGLLVTDLQSVTHNVRICNSPGNCKLPQYRLRIANP